MLQFNDIGHAELIKAFVAAQSEMDGAKKTASNPAFRSKYADLAAICDAVMDALTKNKICVIQSPSFDEGGVHIQTLFAHEGGGMMWDTLSLRPSKTDPQGVGSCITYARRYALAAMCGIAPEDDDGNAASGLSGGSKQEAPKPPIAAQAKRDGTWQTIEEKLRGAKTERELDERAEWFLSNGKIPLSWKDLFDEEWEKCRNDLIAAQVAAQ